LTVDSNSTDGFVTGATLTAHLSDQDGVQNAAYQWSVLQNGVLSTISGATASTYVLNVGDVGKQVEVTAHYTDSFGNEAVTSAPHAVSAPPRRHQSTMWVP
jgi:hypothetical protein